MRLRFIENGSKIEQKESNEFTGHGHLVPRLGEVLLQVFHHGETPDLLLSKHGSHGLIGSVELLSLGVLEVLLLQVGPESLDTLKRRVTNCVGND